jgi:hypothetical protein
MRSERRYARLQPMSVHDLSEGQAIIDVPLSLRQTKAILFWWNGGR